MSDNKTNLDKLNDVLGFDPTKRFTLTGGKAGELFQSTLKEITSEREEKAKADAKQVLISAISLAEEWKKAEKNFYQQKAKFDKELGKLMNQLNGMLNGNAPVEEEKENDSSPV